MRTKEAKINEENKENSSKNTIFSCLECKFLNPAYNKFTKP